MGKQRRHSVRSRFAEADLVTKTNLNDRLGERLRGDRKNRRADVAKTSTWVALGATLVGLAIFAFLRFETGE